MWAKTYVARINCFYRQKHNIPFAPFKHKRHKESTDPCPQILAEIPSDSYSKRVNHFDTALNITHVYYTESDQLLKIRDRSVRDLIISASNYSTHIIGRRCEKHVARKKVERSYPERYMEDVRPTRAACGDWDDNYEIHWPGDKYIRRVNINYTPDKKEDGKNKKDKSTK